MRVRVSGRVQGVWYRETCREMASRLGVAGWVRNDPDGTVVAVLEGEDADVDRLLDWMRTGPPHAVVADVVVAAEELHGEHGFVVR
jgi:acylphosphatase